MIARTMFIVAVLCFSAAFAIVSRAEEMPVAYQATEDVVYGHKDSVWDWFDQHLK